MRLVSHTNVVGLKAFFYSNGDKKDEVFLNLVLEFVPETIYRASRHYTKLKQPMPMLYVKVRTCKIKLQVIHVSINEIFGLYTLFGYMSSRY